MTTRSPPGARGGCGSRTASSSMTRTIGMQPSHRADVNRGRGSNHGRNMNLVGLALRNLKRRPVRTGLSILGIGLAVGSALALISLSRSIKDSTRAGLDEMGD